MYAVKCYRKLLLLGIVGKNEFRDEGAMWLYSTIFLVNIFCKYNNVDPCDTLLDVTLTL